MHLFLSSSVSFMTYDAMSSTQFIYISEISTSFQEAIKIGIAEDTMLRHCVGVSGGGPPKTRTVGMAIKMLVSPKEAGTLIGKGSYQTGAT